jgi:lysine-arginine-ornithine-binding protein
MPMFRLIAILAMLPLAAASADTATLRIGTEAAYPPFEYRDSTGAVKGMDIEIGDALCARMAVKCTWTPQNFDGLIPALKAGKIDMIISSMTATAERAKAVDFSVPYYQSASQFVALKGSGFSSEPEKLRGKTVGVESGTVHQAYLEQRLPDTIEKSYDTLENANLDLESGRVDAVLADKAAMYDWLAKEGAAKGFDYVGEPVVDPLIPGNIAIAVAKGHTDLKAKLDTAIKSILDDGSYDAITKRYFPFSIRPN